MNKVAVIAVISILLAFATFASAQQVCSVKEPGSLLVFPLVDNIFHSTIVDMANLGPQDVTLECYAITHGITNETEFQKIDFHIVLTERQPFYWDTSNSFRGDGFFIPSLASRKGVIYCWAIDNPIDRLEIGWDFLKGDALLYNLVDQRAFAYNAYPHQGINVVGDRILNLNGLEYCAATSRIYFEAFADGFAGMLSTLALANLDNNFPASIQPEVDLGFQCWNEDEQFGSRNSHMQQFIQLEMGPDLLLNQAGVGTDKFQCAVDGRLTGVGMQMPLWGVVFGYIPGSGYEYGGLVWQDRAQPAPTAIILWLSFPPDGDQNG